MFEEISRWAVTFARRSSCIWNCLLSLCYNNRKCS